MRWLLVAVLVFIAYKLISNEHQRRLEKKEKQNKATVAAKAATGEMVKDPTCGTYVNVESSVSVRDGNVIHRFCSYECRDTFLQRLHEQGQAISEEKKD